MCVCSSTRPLVTQLVKLCSYFGRSVTVSTVQIKCCCSHVKPRPNDSNVPTQHVATLLGATCCARLAILLRHAHVGCCWLKCDHVATHVSQHIATRWPNVRNMLPAPNSIIAICCVDGFIALIRLKRTAICRCNCKGSTFSSVTSSR